MVSSASLKRHAQFQRARARKKLPSSMARMRKAIAPSKAPRMRSSLTLWGSPADRGLGIFVFNDAARQSIYFPVGRFKFHRSCYRRRILNIIRSMLAFGPRRIRAEELCNPPQYQGVGMRTIQKPPTVIEGMARVTYAMSLKEAKDWFRAEYPAFKGRPG
jgi:hypothetical protein